VVRSAERAVAEVSGEQHHDTSPPLALIQPAIRNPDRKVHEVKRIPRPLGMTSSPSRRPSHSRTPARRGLRSR
jgi:hypothetical protein